MIIAISLSHPVSAKGFNLLGKVIYDLVTTLPMHLVLKCYFYGVVAVHPSIPILFHYLEMYLLESMDAY